ncbi:hypothetical protein CYMTET_19493 [Cymbomonas tetramitiformis]|uniref:Uncharacterized protein n=1 Tax=Cymbomonas tetramitiformis TaxID=36881 RepID=A0AAE0L585_9CHLO|nr:hypothetical protein CYMTET_19493 [Cymbomonas tetramitiformis]
MSRVHKPCMILDEVVAGETYVRLSDWDVRRLRAVPAETGVGLEDGSVAEAFIIWNDLSLREKLGPTKKPIWEGGQVLDGVLETSGGVMAAVLNRGLVDMA